MPISYAPPPRTKILVAVTRDKIDRLERILEGHELELVDTVSEAMHALKDQSFGIVIVAVHFDDSQMFTLLSDIRAHAAHRKIPILVVLGERGRALSEVAVEGLDHAVKAMTANGFLDLRHFPDDDPGNARIRRIVDYLILINGDLQHLARGAQQVIDIDERRRSRV
jgi:PleD family two-component response regulator